MESLARMIEEGYRNKMMGNVIHVALVNFGMWRIKILKGEYFQPLSDFVFEFDVVNDETVSHERVADLFLADMVASGIRRTDGAPIHLVAEVSMTIGERDIRRAAARAATMADITGETAVAAVVGERISARDRRIAERANVAVNIIRDD